MVASALENKTIKSTYTTVSRQCEWRRPKFSGNEPHSNSRQTDSQAAEREREKSFSERSLSDGEGTASRLCEK